jgi:predicted  nucleic acid-binding Zn-ribbon protein
MASLKGRNDLQRRLRRVNSKAVDQADRDIERLLKQTDYHPGTSRSRRPVSANVSSLEPPSIHGNSRPTELRGVGLRGRCQRCEHLETQLEKADGEVQKLKQRKNQLKGRLVETKDTQNEAVRVHEAELGDLRRALQSKEEQIVRLQSDLNAAAAEAAIVLHHCTQTTPQKRFPGIACATQMTPPPTHAGIACATQMTPTLNPVKDEQHERKLTRHVDSLEARNVLLEADLKATAADNGTLRAECGTLRQQLTATQEELAQVAAEWRQAVHSFEERETKCREVEKRFLLQEEELERMTLEYETVSRSLHGTEEELRRKADMESLLAEFTVRLASASSVHGVMNVVSKDVPNIIGAERAAFYKINRPVEQETAAAATGCFWTILEGGEEIRAPLDAGIVGDAARRGTMVNVARNPSPPREPGGNAQLETIMCHPVFGSPSGGINQVEGVLQVMGRCEEGGIFDRPHEDVLKVT